MRIYTIGHSTRSLDELIGLLRAHGINRLADIRTVPKSRRHPHFSADALTVSLPRAGVSYRHFPGLGGLRKPRRDSRNTAWRHESFRGYADYMETNDFREALADLISWAGAAGPERPGLHLPRRADLGSADLGRADLLGPPEDTPDLSRRPNVPLVAIMCAEAVWWRCHRQLTADALVARGIEVRHITGTGPAAAHKLTEFARVVNGEVSYPGLV
jgi:uncharacterized protein (DUF488 family)